MTGIGDSPSVQVPALYSHAVVLDDDCFVSDTIWCAPRRVVVLEISDIVIGAGSVNPDVWAMILTRVSGGGWLAAIPSGFAPFVQVQPPSVQILEPVLRAVASTSLPFTVLDEARLLLQVGNNDFESQAIATVLDPVTAPDALVVGAGPAGNGVFFNQFGIIGRVPDVASSPLSLSVIDDPDTEGNYIVDVSLGTDENGIVTTTLTDLESYVGSATTQMFGGGAQGNPLSPLLDGFPLTPFVGGTPGDPPPAPVSFTVTIR